MRTPDLFRLDGKLALVTGGSRGLGLQMAEALGEMGASVVLVARSQEALAEARDRLTSLGIETDCVAADLTRERQCRRHAAGHLACGNAAHPC